MDEKIVIKYVDELVNDFLNSPFQDFTTNEFLDFSKRFRTENMKKSERMDLEDSIMDFGLKKKLFKVVEGRILMLDEKGIELKDFGKGYLAFEKSLKSTPITLYQKIHIGLTIISLLLVFIFGCLNYSLNQDKSDLKDENVQLKSDLVLYKDSLNVCKEKALLKKPTTVSDTVNTKDYPDLNN